MVTAHPDTMVLDSIAQCPDVQVVELLAVFIVDDILQFHLRLVFYRISVFVYYDGYVELLGVRLPAVDQKIPETPRDCVQLAEHCYC